MLWLAQVVLSFFVLHRSKIPFVLTTKSTQSRSLPFRKPDGVNSVLRSVYSIITAKLFQPSSAVSGLCHDVIMRSITLIHVAKPSQSSL